MGLGKVNTYRIAGNFHKHKFFANHQQTRQKKILDFLFWRKVMISDRTSYNFTLGNGGPARELSIHFNVETIVYGYKPYLSKRMGRCRRKSAMQKESELTPGIHSQSQWMIGELIARCKKFLQFARFLMGSGARQQCARLPQLVVSNKLWRKKFPTIQYLLSFKCTWMVSYLTFDITECANK